MGKSKSRSSSRLYPHLGDRLLGGVLFFLTMSVLWLWPASLLGNEVLALQVSGVLTVGWLVWQPALTSGRDHSTRSGPDFHSCVRAERSAELKRRLLLSTILGYLTFVAAYIYPVNPPVSLLLTGLFLWACYRIWQPDTEAAPRIVPIYRSGLRNSGTFLRGYAVARHFDDLEKRAGKLGLPPLSTFGFAEALCNEETRWHKASTAIPTLEGLLRDSPKTQDPEISADLEAMLGAFHRAGDGEIALLVRCRNSTNALEWEINGGQP